MDYMNLLNSLNDQSEKQDGFWQFHCIWILIQKSISTVLENLSRREMSILELCEAIELLTRELDSIINDTDRTDIVPHHFQRPENEPLNESDIYGKFRPQKAIHDGGISQFVVDEHGHIRLAKTN